MNNKSELQTIISDTIKYWEVKRIVYNLILLSITALLLYININFDNFQFLELVELLTTPFITLFKLAIVANILYCSAYVVDVFIQLSDYRNSWLKYRWTLFISGTTLASVLAAFYTVILFDFLW